MNNPNPGPWKLIPETDEEYDGDNRGGIEDANGTWICGFGDNTQYYPSEGWAPQEPAATLMLLAPEMEKLLRNRYRQIHGPHCDQFNHHDCEREWNRQRIALLDRIDEARMQSEKAVA